MFYICMSKSNLSITEVLNRFVTIGLKRKLQHTGKNSRVILLPAKVLKSLRTKQNKTFEDLEYLTLKVSSENKIILEE